jgi:hypothetical protein
MLRVTKEQLINAVTYRLEGRLAGEGAEYVRALATQCHTDLRLVVDLTEIMFIDAVGENALSSLKRLGAQFIAETSYSRDVCERLNLALVCNDNANQRLLNGSDEDGCH